MSASYHALQPRIEHIKQLAAAHQKSLPLIIERSISDIDILSWLLTRNESCRVYWRNRTGTSEFAGAGCGMPINPEALSELSALFPENDIIAFYARHFESHTKSDESWAEFPTSTCFIPEISLQRRNTAIILRLCLKISPDSNVSAVVDRLHSLDTRLVATPAFDCFDPAFRLIRHIPDESGWTWNVRQILNAIAAGQVSKIVLARQSIYESDVRFSPGQLLTALASRQTNTYIIFYQTTPDRAFISFSPERLFHRVGRTIAVDALSSTVNRGGTEDEDVFLEQGLKNDGKQLLEHKIVIDGICETLRSLCDGEPHINLTDVLKLSTIQHLRTRITGEMKGIADASLIALLHPTPAVGGTPTAEAIECIQKLEPFQRGLYAAPIGILSRDESELAVGIRSLVMRKNSVAVFTGAGIVAGSVPECEWDEIDSKNILAPFIREVDSDG